MTSKEVWFSLPAARWYLNRIAELTALNPAAAVDFDRQLQTARKNLAKFPDISIRGIFPDTRILIVGDYILTITRKRGGLEIASIRHGKQQDARFPLAE